MNESERFIFLNIEGSLSEIGWDGPKREKLWRYNQHYFDDLNAIDAENREDWHEDLIEKWINENAPGVGCGWEPYPVSLRIVNWIKWAIRTNKLSESALHSLAVQLRWLSKKIEFHLLGNHLIANAKALVFGGFFFEGNEAATWLDKGLRILDREIKEQILPDGAHYELSTMYHAIVFEDILDLINISNCFSKKLIGIDYDIIEKWHNVGSKMQSWYHSMCHSDSEISFFNDAALDIAPNRKELDLYAKRVLRKGSLSAKRNFIHNEDSGYIKILGSKASILIDVAKIGPDCLPGHAHADTLSFEMSLGNQRVIVNSGTSYYGTSPERIRQRGTLAHNTVTIDGRNSSEIWSGFRVARRANPINLKVIQRNSLNEMEIQCSHDGYFYLRGKPIHHRIWNISENEISISDKVIGNYHKAEARYHFHPEVNVKIQPCGKYGTICTGLEEEEFSWFIDQGIGKTEPSTWHPKFGVSIPSICLKIFLENNESKFRIKFTT